MSEPSLRTMGWPLPCRPFINGGVLLLRDCEPTHQFARLWHNKWLAWSSRGRYTDQPSLNSALAESGIDYAVLGNRFNGQVAHRPRTVPRAGGGLALLRFTKQ